MDKLLLHSCCAPCSVYCVDTLRADGIEPTSLWFNPNIHPWTEYDARRRTLLEYGEKEHVEVHILEDYGLRDFVRAVSADIDHRCAHCYTIRLGTAAKYAADHGYDAFTSSLLISPYQNHELLKAVGETMGKKYGVEFYYRDFRPGFREGQAKRARWASTCRNTAAASSLKRTAIRPRSKRRKSATPKNKQLAKGKTRWMLQRVFFHSFAAISASCTSCKARSASSRRT